LRDEKRFEVRTDRAFLEVLPKAILEKESRMIFTALRLETFCGPDGKVANPMSWEVAGRGPGWRLEKPRVNQRSDIFISVGTDGSGRVIPVKGRPSGDEGVKAFWVRAERLEITPLPLQVAPETVSQGPLDMEHQPKDVLVGSAHIHQQNQMGTVRAPLGDLDPRITSAKFFDGVLDDDGGWVPKEGWAGLSLQDDGVEAVEVGFHRA
jgi:hypothetical protein